MELILWRNKKLRTTMAIIHCGGIFYRKFHASLLSFGYGGKNPADFSATYHSQTRYLQAEKATARSSTFVFFIPFAVWLNVLQRVWL